MTDPRLENPPVIVRGSRRKTFRAFCAGIFMVAVAVLLVWLGLQGRPLALVIGILSLLVFLGLTLLNFISLIWVKQLRINADGITQIWPLRPLSWRWEEIDEILIYEGMICFKYTSARRPTQLDKATAKITPVGGGISGNWRLSSEQLLYLLQAAQRKWSPQRSPENQVAPIE